jgi:hypothetical protein
LAEIKTMQQAADRLKELGCKGKHVFRNLADAKAAVARVEARQAGKPSSKPVRDHHKARPINPVSDHFKPASNYRNDPATPVRVSRHFCSKQTRCKLLLSGSFETKMPLSSKHLT